MNRRTILKSLLGLPLAPLAAHAAAPPQKKKNLMLQISEIAGYHYYEGETIRGQLSPMQRVELRAEPGNPHDANAVEVYAEGYKLGYLPRYQNYTISQLLQKGVAVEARIHPNKRANLYRPLAVILYLSA